MTAPDAPGGDDAATPFCRCSRCAKLSPPANSAFTLISAQFGWRLEREAGAEAQWFCPDCWRLRKAVSASTRK